MHRPLSQQPKRVLSVFSLAMINVIAVDSLRSLPIGAEYGSSIIFFYVLGALLFFIPTALVAAELATSWPQSGGIYIWVREAFGKRWALVTIWLQWIYNIVWYPTILAFIAATIAYLINPHLAEQKTYILIVILTMFWGATLLNCFGMRASAWMSMIGAIIGTIIPMIFISLLGIYWIASGQPIHIKFDTHSLLPSLNNFNNLAFLTAILFGLIGMEMSAVHAEEVKNPQHDYPRALLLSTIIILITLVFGSLAIAIVVPSSQISLVSGLIDAFDIFFNSYHMRWMTPVITTLIIIGSICGVATWIIGPTKGLLIAARDGSLPIIFVRTNRYGAPIALLILQGLLFTLLCAMFLMMPDINSSYWILSAMTAQLALLVYIFMFSAVIKLRYKHPNQPRGYKIPGGNKMLWLISLTGCTTCLGAIIIGFLPPSDVKIKNLFEYELILTLGIIISCATALLLYSFQQRCLQNKLMKPETIKPDQWQN